MRIALLYGALTGVAVALVAMAAYVSHRRTQFDVVDNALSRSAQQIVVGLASARVAADSDALLSGSRVADASIRVFDIHGALIGQSTNSATVPPFRVCAVRPTTNEQCLAVRRAGDAASSRATAYRVVRDSLGARWRVHALAVDDRGQPRFSLGRELAQHRSIGQVAVSVASQPSQMPLLDAFRNGIARSRSHTRRERCANYQCQQTTSWNNMQSVGESMHYSSPPHDLPVVSAIPIHIIKTEQPMDANTLTPELLQQMDAYWRAANYLSVGQMYLYDNPLMKRPLTLADVKRMLLGHWGTTPGQNFIYVHLNRVIKKYDVNMIYVSGPGHGGPAVVANTYLEGTYSEVYPHISQDEAGLQKLFLQFSFPGGIPSHASPETPGSIHEGGELGYSLSHAFGAAFDNPDLVVACVIGDGEAETGPLATAWHSNKFLDPVTDGAVLPILHLNEYKIANPTILARITREELEQLLRGCGWTPYFVEGHEPTYMHEAMAATLDMVVEHIKQIQKNARIGGNTMRPRWPMIVLNSPKGWTGPKVVDGRQIEGAFRSHQVPLSDPATHPEHLPLLEDWLKSYRPNELFDDQGRLNKELAELAPTGERRMGANPHANGGLLLRELRLPDFRNYSVEVSSRGVRGIGDTHVLGRFLRDVVKVNMDQRNFRVFGPDETLSNGLEALFEVTNRQWGAAIAPNDEFLAPTGRVMEMLSEHQCQGWLEGYLLTGRHGLFNCYEAFIHIVDSMFNQHAKWLDVTSHLPWRRKIASLNYLLTSHVWRQDHNGFTHQDPGFIDVVMNKKADIVRVYLPPDANCLLSVMDHCLRSRHYVNVVIAGKHPAPQWLTMDAAVAHCTAGIGIWQWASNDADESPDVVMACCGDVPTLETLAAVSLMREHLPALKIRVVNVVDLMKLQPHSEHPHGLSDADFDALFTTDKPVIFAFHGYPWLIHRLTYRRTNHVNIHVRGYKEEGTITTAFDMTVLNDMDRYHLVMDTIRRVPQAGNEGIGLTQRLITKLQEHKQYIAKFGQDMPEIRNWQWGVAHSEEVA